MFRCLSSLVILGLLASACDSPAEPNQKPSPAKAPDAEPVAAKPEAKSTPEPTPEPTPDPVAKPPTATGDGEWEHGTITLLGDGMYAIHADDDSATICFPDLPVEFQKEDLAVLYQGDLDPPIPRDRRMCRIATNMEIKPAP